MTTEVILGAALSADAAKAMLAAKHRWRYLGDQELHTACREVTIEDMPYVLQSLLPDMERLHAKAWTPGVGLTANQIGVNLRVTIALLGTKGTGKGGVPISGTWVRLINPKITNTAPATVLCTEEGCLSVPKFRTSMARYPWVAVAYNDADQVDAENPLGKRVQRRLDGFDAQVMQHEFEHLQGVTIVDHLPRQQRRAAERAMAKFKEKGR